MLEAIVLFLVLLNPFAMFIFLQPVLRKTSIRDLMVLLGRAILVSFVLFCVFAVSGDFFFRNVLQVQFDSFRIFGGMVITYLAFVMIVQGKKSFITYNEDHSIVSSEIVMPLMVGAGTILLSVIMGNSFGKVNTIMALALVMVITFILIMILALLRKKIVKKFAKSFDKNMDTALRLIAFFAGTIGLDMILVGLKNMWG